MRTPLHVLWKSARSALLWLCHINGIESFWGYAKHRLQKFKGIPKETEFRFNLRGQNLYHILLQTLRDRSLKIGAYPQLDIRLNWDREKTADNIAPFLDHFPGMFSSAGGRGLLPYSHGAVKGNRFALEGGCFSFKKISSVLKTYGIGELKDDFLLIGLVQNKKTVGEFVGDFKKYDTEDDWTYNFDDDSLREISEDIILSSRYMSGYLAEAVAFQNTSNTHKNAVDNRNALL